MEDLKLSNRVKYVSRKIRFFEVSCILYMKESKTTKSVIVQIYEGATKAALFARARIASGERSFSIVDTEIIGTIEKVVRIPLEEFILLGDNYAKEEEDE